MLHIRPVSLSSDPYAHTLTPSVAMPLTYECLDKKIGMMLMDGGHDECRKRESGALLLLFFEEKRVIS